jgi:hypothetical protein
MRRVEKPLTKAGQLRALGQEIQIALDDGQSLNAIPVWLEEQGVVFKTDNLRTYVSRIRRQRRKKTSERCLRQPDRCSVGIREPQHRLIQRVRRR